MNVMLCSLLLHVSYALILLWTTQELEATESYCRGLPGYNCTYTMIRDLEETKYGYNNSQPSDPKDPQIPCDNITGQINVTWEPPINVNGLKGFVVMLIVEPSIRYYHFNMSAYMSEYPEHAGRNEGMIKMGLIDLNVFEAFNLSTKRRTAVQVRIISVPGNKAIDKLQFIGRNITVTRTLQTTTAATWTANFTITATENNNVTACFRIPPERFQYDRYYVRLFMECIRNHLETILKFTHRIEEGLIEGEETCLHFGSLTGGCSFNVRMTPIINSSDTKPVYSSYSFNTSLNTISDVTETDPSGVTTEHEEFGESDIRSSTVNPDRSALVKDVPEEFEATFGIAHVLGVIFTITAMSVCIIGYALYWKSDRQQVLFITPTKTTAVEEHVIKNINYFITTNCHCTLHLKRSYKILDDNWNFYHRVVLIIKNTTREDAINEYINYMKKNSDENQHKITWNIATLSATPTMKQISNVRVVPATPEDLTELFPPKHFPISWLFRQRAKHWQYAMTSSVSDYNASTQSDTPVLDLSVIEHVMQIKDDSFTCSDICREAEAYHQHAQRSVEGVTTVHAQHPEEGVTTMHAQRSVEDVTTVHDFSIV